MKLNNCTSFATRRLWLRRWLRVWSIIGAAVTAPVRFIWWYIRPLVKREWPSDGWWGFTVASVILTGFGWIVWSGYDRERHASPELILAESKADSCFENTIKRRAAQWERPVLNGDVYNLKYECAKYWADRYSKEQQAKVLKIQSDALK